MDLKLKDLRDDKIKRSEFKEQLQKLIPKQAFFFRDAHPIAYAALRLIKDLNTKRSIKSVEINSKLVLQEFFHSLSESSNYAHLFIINILELYEFPIVIKNQIELVVKHDLARIDSLIQHYHTLEFIERFNEKKAVPRDHSERTILDFYNRTLKKRSELIDYMISKLDDRAIQKSTDQNKPYYSGSKENKAKQKFLDRLDKEYVRSKDFPYRDMVIDFKRHDYKYLINFERLDYRKINPVINKYFSAGVKLDPSRGYNKKFYSSINKIDIPKKLHSLITLVKEIPIAKKRLDIFKELHTLFVHRHWYGFYSLALPQIEGIFSEMVQASVPTGKLKGTLTDKVQQIRPFYENSNYSFDYYEYWLPNERNSFSHTGKVSEVKKKCKILALDLVAIVQVFNELDSPIIRLKKILDQGPSFITDVGRISNLLHLISITKKNDLFENVERECNDFAYKILPKEIDLTTFIRNLSSDFKSGFEDYKDKIHLFSGAFEGERIDLGTLPGPNITKSIKRLQEVHEKYSYMFEENLKLLLDTHYVVNNYNLQFPLTPDNIRNSFANFSTEHQSALKIIKILDEKLVVKTPDDFLLLKKDLTHYIGDRNKL